jgi:hypothetical protein
MPAPEKWTSDDRTVERREAERGAADAATGASGIERDAPEERKRSIMSPPGVGSTTPGPKEVE